MRRRRRCDAVGRSAIGGPTTRTSAAGRPPPQASYLRSSDRGRLHRVLRGLRSSGRVAVLHGRLWPVRWGRSRRSSYGSGCRRSGNERWRVCRWLGLYGRAGQPRRVDCQHPQGAAAATVPARRPDIASAPAETIDRQPNCADLCGLPMVSTRMPSLSPVPAASSAVRAGSSGCNDTAPQDAIRPLGTPLADCVGSTVALPSVSDNRLISSWASFSSMATGSRFWLM